ncbi:hypothetical protein [Erwinia phage vB_Ea277G]|nr:hypothetical protein [Erwinia phage vB_Ea277G]
MKNFRLVIVETGWELWGGGRLLGRLLSHRDNPCADYLFLFSETQKRCHRYFLYQESPDAINRHQLVKVMVELIYQTGYFPGVLKAALATKVRFAIEDTGFVMYSKNKRVARADRNGSDLRWAMDASVLQRYGYCDDSLNAELNADYRDWVLLHPKTSVGHVERINIENRFNYHSKSLYYFAPGYTIPDVKFVRRVSRDDEIRAVIVGLLFGHPFAYAITYTSMSFEDTLPLLREALSKTFGFELSSSELHLQLVNLDLFNDTGLTTIANNGKPIGRLPTNALNSVAGIRKVVEWFGWAFGFKFDEITDLPDILVEGIYRLYRREQLLLEEADAALLEEEAALETE